jgi:hypothetical protein
MELCVAGKEHQLFLIAQINGQRVHVMIDSGATGNFIDKQQATEFGFPLEKKQELYTLYALNRGTLGLDKGQVTFKTKVLTMKMLRGHIEDI